MKEHGLPLYLPSELNMGLVDLQHKKRLGRSYAGLLAINEGLYQLGCISEKDYEYYKKRYSDPLVKAKPLTKAEIGSQKKLKKLEKLFSQVIEQWPTLSEKAKLSHIANAEKYEASVPNAKFVLALANGNSEPNAVCEKVSMKPKEVETK